MAVIDRPAATPPRRGGGAAAATAATTVPVAVAAPPSPVTVAAPAAPAAVAPATPLVGGGVNVMTPSSLIATVRAVTGAAAAGLAAAKDVRRYVLLPDRGLRAAETLTGSHVAGFFRSLSTARNLTAVVSSAAPRLAGVGAAVGGLIGGAEGAAIGRLAGAATGAAAQVTLKVLDSVAENGAKLVEMSAGDVGTFRAISPGVRVVPVLNYRPAFFQRRVDSAVARPTAGGASTATTVRVVSKADGQPVADARVVAFTDFAAKTGAEGVTDSAGRVNLALFGSNKIERLYVYPKRSFWSLLRQNVTLSGSTTLQLEPVDLGFVDVLRHFYGISPLNAGTGVRVGIVDTGVEPSHPDLLVEGGRNTITGEDPNDFGDNGEGHGTHVAGIVAARGSKPSGIRGVAPGATLRSYRVFPGPDSTGDSFAIAKAIDRAVQDGCDLVNLSLKLEGAPLEVDQAVQEAIEDARRAGVLLFAAAGNDDRSPVSFPARDPLVLAVSAMGRKGTFPSGTTEQADVANPFGKDPADFVAAFSNVGPQVDLVGPGVGVLSTVPGGYAPMSGTSMACPAVCGAAARLLAARPDLLNAARNEARRDALAAALLQSAVPLGFKSDFEGQGLPR